MQDEANGAGDRPWVGISANAGSGFGRGRDRVGRFTEALRAQGLDPRVAWTPGERRDMVRQSGEDPRCRCLAAVGGDGTVAALINERPAV
ncbi:MAG: diacylglycerol kinase family protein, partial [Isosphaeraceae bacterium]